MLEFADQKEFMLINDPRKESMKWKDVTEILGENIFTISFFPSMKNDQTFIRTIYFNKERDFIIPRYENLLKFANYIIQKETQLAKTIDIEVYLPGQNRY